MPDLLADGLPPYEFKRDFLDLDDLPQKKKANIFKESVFVHQNHINSEQEESLNSEIINKISQNESH